MIKLILVGTLLLNACLAATRPVQSIRPSPAVASARAANLPHYAIGNPTLHPIWVDPAGGDDRRDGNSPATALRTVVAAWDQIPATTPLTNGYAIELLPGTYNADSLPTYFEDRHGSYEFPIILRADRGPGSALLTRDLNMANLEYIYLIDLNIEPDPPTDTLHCERCDHLLVRGLRLNGGHFEPGASQVAYDNFKVNQSQYVYLEDSDISGAIDNSVDFVAVAHGQIVGNRIHNAQDWCMYQKGGSHDFLVMANEFSDCGTGGFTAGQGSGFQFLTSPFIHYEAESIRVVDNIVHDTAGAGLGVNGGYNILLAYNTLYRVGTRDHLVEVGFGLRSCDGRPGDPGRELCASYLANGGWGTTVEDDGTNAVRIPSKHVYIFNNLVYNPAGTVAPQHLAVPGSYNGAPQAGSNVPVPTLGDDDLRFEGNLIWNGTPDQPLGIEDPGQGCQTGNPTCTAEMIRAANTINTTAPQLVAPDQLDFHPVTGSPWLALQPVPIPAFPGGDRPTTPPESADALTTNISLDFDGRVRTGPGTIGAFAADQATFYVEFPVAMR